MTMVVECESCRSRFRLKKSLLKESNEVLFRCRKCGGSIMVRNPRPPPVVPVLAVSAKIAPPMEADIFSVVRAGNEQAAPAVEVPAHRVSGEPPVPRGRGIPETPVPRRNVRRWHMSVALSSNPVVMVLVAVIGTAMGCLVLYFLFRGLAHGPEWLSRLIQ
jgi:predicted Zn finger-like uncharacterized protein